MVALTRLDNEHLKDITLFSEELFLLGRVEREFPEANIH